VLENQAFFNLKALIVGDDAVLRDRMRALLQVLALGQICEAESPAAAAAAIREHRPDVVVCDLAMAPDGGVAFVKRMRLDDGSPNPYVPIIMVVEQPDRPTIEAVRDCGVTEILTQPFTAQNLGMRIAEIVERPRGFVRCQTYFGPDRRRRRDRAYDGPLRRKDDAPVERYAG
jgi:two-component system, chemotaxis family, chemotaxis protein CheY